MSKFTGTQNVKKSVSFSLVSSKSFSVVQKTHYYCIRPICAAAIIQHYVMLHDTIRCYMILCNANSMLYDAI